jgi:dTDP-4-amino-4,6-dideoxygalactose transaminase
MALGIIPRGIPDIGFSDLFFALAKTFFPKDRLELQKQVELNWGGAALACLSVRSGLDALLQAWQLPAGSEVLISALTIRDMAVILREHGLVVVPVDLDPETMGVDLASLQQAITPNTRALLVAHLLGTRMDLDGVFEIAHKHNIPVLEDCAQAYDGEYHGDSRSLVSFFSFGSIKTATALGGALLRFQERSLLERVRAIQTNYPIQAMAAYRKRVLLFSILRLLANPIGLGGLTWLLRLFGKSPDDILSQIVKGFPGSELLKKLRYQPNSALLATLLRRIRQPYQEKIRRRVLYAQRIYEKLGDFPRPARHASHHTHWVIALRSPNADQHIENLQAAGFDATRKASSMTFVPAPTGFASAKQVEALTDELFYLPMYPALSPAEIQHLANSLQK